MFAGTLICAGGLFYQIITEAYPNTFKTNKVKQKRIIF